MSIRSALDRRWTDRLVCAQQCVSNPSCSGVTSPPTAELPRLELADSSRGRLMRVGRTAHRRSALILPIFTIAPLAMVTFVPRLSGQTLSPSAAPTAYVPIGIPKASPRGWDPHIWSLFRQHCQEIANKAASHIPFAQIGARPHPAVQCTNLLHHQKGTAPRCRGTSQRHPFRRLLPPRVRP